MFVAGDNVDEMVDKVRRFNTIRNELGLPPDQPTTLLWMYCAETEAEAEEGWVYFHNQLTAAQHHYFEWNNPGYEGIHGYEEYLLRQNADISTADAGFAARRATQPIGTPDQIIERIKTLQQTISLEKVVIHMFYGGQGTRPKRASDSLPRRSYPRCRPCPHRSIPDPWVSPSTEAAKPVGG